MDLKDILIIGGIGALVYITYRQATGLQAAAAKVEGLTSPSNLVSSAITGISAIWGQIGTRNQPGPGEVLF